MVDKYGRLQRSDIPTEQFLIQFNAKDWINITDIDFYQKFPRKLILTKANELVKQGLIECGVDRIESSSFYLTKKGVNYLKSKGLIGRPLAKKIFLKRMVIHGKEYFLDKPADTFVFCIAVEELKEDSVRIQQFLDLLGDYKNVIYSVELTNNTEKLISWLVTFDIRKISRFKGKGLNEEYYKMIDNIYRSVHTNDIFINTKEK